MNKITYIFLLASICTGGLYLYFVQPKWLGNIKHTNQTELSTNGNVDSFFPIFAKTVTEQKASELLFQPICARDQQNAPVVNIESFQNHYVLTPNPENPGLGTIDDVIFTLKLIRSNKTPANYFKTVLSPIEKISFSSNQNSIHIFLKKSANLDVSEFCSIAALPTAYEVLLAHSNFPAKHPLFEEPLASGIFAIESHTKKQIVFINASKQHKNFGERIILKITNNLPPKSSTRSGLFLSNKLQVRTLKNRSQLFCTIKKTLEKLQNSCFSEWICTAQESNCDLGLHSKTAFSKTIRLAFVPDSKNEVQPFLRKIAEAANNISIELHPLSKDLFLKAVTYHSYELYFLSAELDLKNYEAALTLLTHLTGISRTSLKEKKIDFSDSTDIWNYFENNGLAMKPLKFTRKRS